MSPNYTHDGIFIKSPTEVISEEWDFYLEEPESSLCPSVLWYSTWVPFLMATEDG